MDEIVELRDSTGVIRQIPAQEILRALVNTMIMGMTLPVVSQLRAEYLKRGGVLPMSELSVRETFET